MAMTKQQLEALVALLNRLPMSRAEALWVQRIIERIEATIVQQAAPTIPETPE